VAEIDELLKVGADEVIPDELGAGLELATFLMKRCNVRRAFVQAARRHPRRASSALPSDRRSPRSLTGYLSVLEGGRLKSRRCPTIRRTLVEPWLNSISVLPLE